MVEQEAEIRAGLDAAEQAFRSHPRVKGLTAEWRSSVGMPVDCLARESRSADLVIIGRDLQRLRDGPDRSADPGELVLASGRPVLVVPPGAASLQARSVLVAGRRPARRGGRCGTRRLSYGRRRRSTSWRSPSPPTSTGRRRGSASHAPPRAPRHPRPWRGPDAARGHGGRRADPSGRAARGRSHRFGGYGHARLREWAFGGVTRDLLRHCPKCCLMCLGQPALTPQRSQSAKRVAASALKVRSVRRETRWR
jgi:nucleotide-binding universal stress UspA family protein